MHVANLDADRRAIVFKEAKVLADGEVAFGRETVVPLAEARDVDASSGMLAVLGRSGNLLVQLHIETSADRQAWCKCIRNGINTARAAATGRGAQDSAAGPVTEDTDDELPMLQARSRQLQDRIASLEVAGERRDKHLRKMLSRLNGAMQMLTAVQEMVGQQRNVIIAQKVAIEELTREEEGTEEKAQWVSEDEDEDDEGEEEEDGGREREIAKAESEIAMKTEQMLALLQRADEMQRALHELEAMEAASNGAASNGAPATNGAPAVNRPNHSEQQAPPVPPESTDDSDQAGPEAVLNRLRALEAEKQRFEGMLAESQNEHEGLLNRLNDMRSLMAMLGIDTDDADGSEGSGGEADGRPNGRT